MPLLGVGALVELRQIAGVKVSYSTRLKLSGAREHRCGDALAAVALGMGVNCGHDLNLRNTPLLAREVPEIVEASIGHALIADALYLGFAETVRRYARVCRGEAVDAPVTQ